MSRLGWFDSGPGLLWRAVLSGVSGALLAMAFAPFDLLWAAPVAVALSTMAWWRARWRQALVLGYLNGVVFHAILLWWLHVLGWDAWVTLTLVWSLWWLALAAGVAAITWWRWWPIAVPALWLLVEAVRARAPLGGFPWGRVAFSQADTTFTPWAALGGAPLVTAMTLVSGTAALWALSQFLGRHWAATVVGVAAALAAVVAGLAVPLPVAGQGAPDTATLAVVQGSVPRTGLDFNAQRRAVLNNHIDATSDLAAAVRAGEVPAPDAVIWPENASDVDPLTDAKAREAISATVDDIGVPVLVGAVLAVTPDSLWNTGIVWLPGVGPSDQYVKQHPVPFGEYLPGRQLLTPLISRFERIPVDFVGGDVPGVLQLGPAVVGDVICFEIAYDTLVRDTVRSGARALIVQTNNATYAATPQPAQQVAMSQLRAVEHGRSVLIAATSGVTAIIAPDGRVVAELPEQEQGWLVEEVALRDTLTVADQVGWWPEAALSLFAAFAWWRGALLRHRSLRAAARTASTPGDHSTLVSG